MNTQSPQTLHIWAEFPAVAARKVKRQKLDFFRAPDFLMVIKALLTNNNPTLDPARPLP